MSTTEDHQVKVDNIHTEDHTIAVQDKHVPVHPLSRRNLLMNIGIALNALVGLAITVPVIGYVIGPSIRKKGYYKSWLSDEVFQVFAINCAHLGCPVRWFPQSNLFMCPCHGGVYYQDGSRAAGPPDRGMFEYQWKLVNGELQINAGQLPTLSTQASLRKDAQKGTSCLG